VTNIFVGNLDFAVTEDQLKAVFAPYGVVESVKLVFDLDNGQSRAVSHLSKWRPRKRRKMRSDRSTDQRWMSVRWESTKLATTSEENSSNDSFRGHDHRRRRI